MIEALSSMPKLKDAEIKNLSTTKRGFMSALKKVSRQTEKLKPPSK